MGYNTATGVLDMFNSNTPGHPDPTNPVQSTYQRSIATISGTGAVTTQPVDSCSGNNGLSAIIGSNGVIYTAGNAGNGTSKATAAVLADQLSNTGVQIVTPGNPNTTSAGVYNLMQNGDAADKASKDPNVRSITIQDNKVYVTKGSGGNGINTVYSSAPPALCPPAATTRSRSCRASAPSWRRTPPPTHTRSARSSPMTRHRMSWTRGWPAP